MLRPCECGIPEDLLTHLPAFDSHLQPWGGGKNNEKRVNGGQTNASERATFAFCLPHIEHTFQCSGCVFVPQGGASKK